MGMEALLNVGLHVDKAVIGSDDGLLNTMFYFLLNECW